MAVNPVELNQSEMGALYFEAPMNPQVSSLIAQASEAYGTPEAESFLQQALALAPDDLTVIVAAYRFYYYQHRLEQALRCGERALSVAGTQLCWPTWDSLSLDQLQAQLATSTGLARFYLLALKGVGYLYLRLGQREAGEARLRRLMQLDPQDQLGAGALLAAIYPSENNIDEATGEPA